MKSSLRRVLACLTFAIFAITSWAAGPTPSVDVAELTALKLDFDAKLAPVREQLEQARKTRTDRYVQDLVRLEAQLSTARQPEAVNVVRQEREAYEGGKQTVGFDPKDKKVPDGLLQLRLAFERDLVTKRTSLSAGPRTLAGEHARKLQALERQLISDKRHAAAEAVKAEYDLAIIRMANPLKTYLRSPVGAWKWTKAESETSRTFEIDGTWHDNRNAEGKWNWTNEAKGEFTIHEKLRSDAEMKVDEAGLQIGGQELGGGMGWQTGIRVR